MLKWSFCWELCWFSLKALLVLCLFSRVGGANRAGPMGSTKAYVQFVMYTLIGIYGYLSMLVGGKSSASHTASKK